MWQLAETQCIETKNHIDNKLFCKFKNNKNGRETKYTLFKLISLKWVIFASTILIESNFL